MLANYAINNTKWGIDFLDTQCKLSGMKWYEKAKRLMTDKHIKQHDLIEVFEVKTRGAVGHYLSGRRQPSPHQMKALADKLGCGLDELMNSDEVSPAQAKINTIIRAAETAMAQSNHDFTEEEKLSVYRAAFNAGLDMNISNEQLTAYLGLFVKK